LHLHNISLDVHTILENINYDNINYDEIFSLVVRHSFIGALFALVASWDLDLKQMDIKTVFLYGDLED